MPAIGDLLGEEPRSGCLACVWVGSLGAHKIMYLQSIKGVSAVYKEYTKGFGVKTINSL